MILAEANALREEQRWTEAAKAYARFLQIDEGTPAIHVQHGHALKESGDRLGALVAYDRAIAIDPSNPDAALHRAHLLKIMGDPAALQAFRRLSELDATLVSAEELARIETVFGQPTSCAVLTEAPPSSVAAGIIKGSAVRVVKDLPAGLHARRRAVRFIADLAIGAPAPKLLVMLDGQIFWSGEIQTRQGACGKKIDSVFSFPEPDRPTDKRAVSVEALTSGVIPAQASILLDYAARFEGEFTIGRPDRDGQRAGIARFVDREQLTITPTIRVTDAESVPVAVAVTGWRSDGIGFEVAFTTAHPGMLRLYPAWSTQELSACQNAETHSDVHPAASAVCERKVVGRILSVADGHVEGWALRPGNLERTVLVDIYAGERLVGCDWADRPQSALAETVGGTGAHGFRISLPASLAENTLLKAYERGCATHFAEGRLPARPAGTLVASAQTAPPSLLAEKAVTHPPYSIAALLLFDDDETQCDDMRLAMAKENVVVHKLRRREADFLKSFNEALVAIDEDLVLVLGEEVVWEASALATMKRALVESSATLAVPILRPHRRTDRPGGPDRWGWSLELSREGGMLRPSPPSPWLEMVAEAAPFVEVVGADWAVASLIDRRRWLKSVANELLGPVIADRGRGPRAPIFAIDGTRIVLAAQAIVHLSCSLPVKPLQLPEYYSRSLAQSLKRRPLSVGAISARPPVIALLVTTTRDDALEGDVIVARELASALSVVLPYAELRLISRNPDGGADLNGIDAVICLRHDCDPRRFQNLSPSCRIVFWVRNWFDEFLGGENWRRADEVWMSSDAECTRFLRHTGLSARLLRIATNLKLFGEAEAQPYLACDICFTGSYWGVHREIATSLVPEILDATVRVFGIGWEDVPELSAVSQGPASYALMPAVYASAKLVIDDANHVTVNSGSVNSRVYDAIAAGALPISNGVLGALETFGNLLPTYSDAHSLTEQIRYWLADEPRRQARVAALQLKVMSEHGFKHRAEDVAGFLADPLDVPFVALTGDGPDNSRTSGAPPAALVPLMNALAGAGWRADWIPPSDWNGHLAASASLRLHVGAAPPPAVREGQDSVAWILSEADALSPRIVRQENVVFVSAETRRNSPDLPQGVEALDWPARRSDFDAIAAHLTSLATAQRSRLHTATGSR